MKLLEMLRNASEADYDDLVAKISALESELNGLKELRKVIGIRLGKEQPKIANFKGNQGRRRMAASDENGNDGQPSDVGTGTMDHMTQTERHRLRAKEYIMANGPSQARTIVRQCGIPEGSITAVLKHKWFVKTPNGYQVTR